MVTLVVVLVVVAVVDVVVCEHRTRSKNWYFKWLLLLLMRAYVEEFLERMQSPSSPEEYAYARQFLSARQLDAQLVGVVAPVWLM